MTVNEAVELLKDWIEYVNEKKEIWREVVLTDTEGEVIAKMLLDMENEIALLCCGNCQYYDEDYNQCNQPERKEKWGDLSADRTDNCSMWENELQTEKRPPFGGLFFMFYEC